MTYSALTPGHQQKVPRDSVGKGACPLSRKARMPSCLLPLASSPSTYPRSQISLQICASAVFLVLRLPRGAIHLSFWFSRSTAWAEEERGGKWFDPKAGSRWEEGAGSQER